MTLLSLLPVNLLSDDVLLALSVLIFFALLVTKVGYKLGVPSLLLFLGVGMVFGQDGVGIRFNNFEYVQFVGNIAMIIILLTGGLETNYQSIKPVMREGIVLSTAGVLLTTAFTGGFIFLISKWMPQVLPLGLLSCFLLAAAMSSTDSASVFSILRGNKMKLKNNLDHILELESGSNDPMAFVLTIILVNIITATQSANGIPTDVGAMRVVEVATVTLLMQLFVGAALGLGMGFLTRWLVRKMQLKNTSMNAILILSLAFFTSSIAAVLKGNGLLAVYIAAIIIGNDRKLPYKKDIMKFMDGLTWLVQLLMFLLLGLLVNPSELPSVAVPALLIALFMSFVARPVSVFALTWPFKEMTHQGRAFVSWVGLKGAAPILFSIYPVVAGVPGARSMFNIVFFITLLSLLMQGMTIPKVARKLGVEEVSDPEVETFGIDMPEEMGTLSDYVIQASDLANGNTLKDLEMPSGKRVIMIRRGDTNIVPEGNVTLAEGDKLLVLNYTVSI